MARNINKTNHIDERRERLKHSNLFRTIIKSTFAERIIAL
jgi:hypothetical protein